MRIKTNWYDTQDMFGEYTSKSLKDEVTWYIQDLLDELGGNKDLLSEIACYVDRRGVEYMVQVYIGEGDPTRFLFKTEEQVTSFITGISFARGIFKEFSE